VVGAVVRITGPGDADDGMAGVADCGYFCGALPDELRVGVEVGNVRRHGFREGLEECGKAHQGYVMGERRQRVSVREDLWGLGMSQRMIRGMIQEPEQGRLDFEDELCVR